MIKEGKSYTFKNPETKFRINKNLSCNSKNLVYIIECSRSKEIYIKSTQALNTRTSLHMSNIKIEENRKLNVSKYVDRLIGIVLEYSPMGRETGVQSQVESYQRLKKIVLDTSLLNTQHYKVRFKGKVEQSREKRPPTLRCSSY